MILTESIAMVKIVESPARGWPFPGFFRWSAWNFDCHKNHHNSVINGRRREPRTTARGVVLRLFGKFITCFGLKGKHCCRKPHTTRGGGQAFSSLIVNRVGQGPPADQVERGARKSRPTLSLSHSYAVLKLINANVIVCTYCEKKIIW